MADIPQDALYFSQEHRKTIDEYLPAAEKTWRNQDRPFVTLTFATSLDSQLALASGVRTALSGPESKAMTHYLRSKHDAILIGVGTAVADDPGLNCRLSGAGGYGAPGTTQQPRPIIVDPSCRWEISESSKIIQMTREGKGLAPFILTRLQEQPPTQREVLERYGGRYIYMKSDPTVSSRSSPIAWIEILGVLTLNGIQSVMIEGGGSVINSLLSAKNQPLVDSVIVTIAPTWLGSGGVVVSPDRSNAPTLPVARMKAVRWYPLGDDAVLCGTLTDYIALS